MDAIQAGLLHVKLPHLAKWNEQRRGRAAEYKRLVRIGGNPVHALTSILVSRRLPPIRSTDE